MSNSKNIYILKRVNDGKHKYIIITPQGKKIKFGAHGYSDYTIHKDKERMMRYIKRHNTNENWNDKNSKGFWSRWILWNKPTITDSIKSTEKKFKIKVILN